MSTLGSYPTRTFKESQKFLVLDPETQSTSLVLGRDLVEYITPQSTYVFAEQSRAVAQNEDYQIGALIQTAGDVTAGDSFAGTFLVVPGGDGDFPMANGNDLLIIRGDILLREQLASNAPGEGSDLVAYTGTAETVTEALDRQQSEVDKRVIYVGTVAELEALDGSPGDVVILSLDMKGGEFIWISGDQSSEVTNDPQQGVWVAGSGDVTGASGAWKRRGVDYSNIRAEWFGARIDNSTDDHAAWQAAIDWAAQAFQGSQGAIVRAKTGATLISDTINQPNRVTIAGPNGRGLIFKPHPSFASAQMFFAANGTSSMFGSRIEDCYIDARGFNMQQVILSYAWQETCGLNRVVIQYDGTTRYGLLYQNGYGGAAYLPIKDCEIFCESTESLAAAIRVDEISLVGGFVLSIDGLTVAGSATNPITSGVQMFNDSLVVRGLHVEYCDSAIVMLGSGSLSADTVTGSANAVVDLIGLGSGFTGKVSARNLIPNGASGQVIKNNITGTNIPASQGMVAEYVYPSVRSENTALAWVVFDGSTGSILSSFNVDSVTRASTGNYTINYSSPLPSAERGISWSTNVDSADAVIVTTTGSTSTTDLVKVRRLGAAAGAYYDAQRVKITVFGNSVI